MKKILTVHGDAIIDTSEIIGFMPKIQRDGNPHILLRCGVMIFMDEWHFNNLKKELIK